MINKLSTLSAVSHPSGWSTVPIWSDSSWRRLLLLGQIRGSSRDGDIGVNLSTGNRDRDIRVNLSTVCIPPETTAAAPAHGRKDGQMVQSRATCEIRSGQCPLSSGVRDCDFSRISVSHSRKVSPPSLRGLYEASGSLKDHSCTCIADLRD